MKKIFIYFLKLVVFPTIRRITEIEGRGNLPKSGNFILSANHTDSMDHFIISYILDGSLKNVNFVGALDSPITLAYSIILYYLSDTIAIHRRKIKRGKFLEKVAGFLKSGRIIVLYPEGDTSKKNVLLRGKTGVAELALCGNVPIVPVGIIRNKKHPEVIVKIGKPLYLERERKAYKEDYSSDKEKKDQKSYYLFLRETTDKIMREISKLSRKPYPYDSRPETL